MALHPMQIAAGRAPAIRTQPRAAPDPRCRPPAEYSGGPSTQETYLYARTLLDVATAQPDGRGRALICGGGIANFTDVAATFKGIIQVGPAHAVYVGGLPRVRSCRQGGRRRRAAGVVGGRAGERTLVGGIRPQCSVAVPLPTPPPVVQAIRERADAIRASKMGIFVRRGGPNYQAGLDMMRRLGEEIGAHIEVGGDALGLLWEGGQE